MTNFSRSNKSIDCLIIHHSVTDPNSTTVWSLSDIDRERVYEPGGQLFAPFSYQGKDFWGCYHWVIWPDGHAENPIDEEHWTWNCGTDKNYTSIAICFVGNYEQSEPTKEALTTCKRIINEIKTRLNIKNIYLHRDLYATACPGKYITLAKIMEIETMLTLSQVDQAYCDVLRRHIKVSADAQTGEEVEAYKLKRGMQWVELYADLARSDEHKNIMSAGIKKLDLPDYL